MAAVERGFAANNNKNQRIEAIADPEARKTSCCGRGVEPLHTLDAQMTNHAYNMALRSIPT